MPNISLVGESQAGGIIDGPGNPLWTVNGLPISMLGDAVVNHGSGPHQGAVMIQGSSWMSIDGIPVVRSGDLATCGHTSDGDLWMTLPD